MREVMLIFHFIGLAMGMGTGFAHAFLGKASAKMPPDAERQFKKMKTMGKITLITSLAIVVAAVMVFR